MPPSVPCGIPSDGIVFARLLVDGEDRGVKPFLVPIHDGRSMCPGITVKFVFPPRLTPARPPYPLSRRLSPHCSSSPINHALTYFNHVRLPTMALLTTPHTKDPRAEFFHNISRVVTGTLSMAALHLPMLRITSYIAGKYSLRRKVTDALTRRSRPIISFSTQYIPVMTAIADTFVSITFIGNTHAAFRDPRPGHGVEHFLAAVSKVTTFGHAIKDIVVLGDRCGAQGLLRANQFDGILVRMKLSSVR